MTHRIHNSQFCASNGWLEKFMNRHGLSVRVKTSISQKLPAQLEKKLESFMVQIRALRAKHQYPKELIINMDETPMYFDMVPGYTINKKGAKEVHIRSSGSDKKRMTAVVTCTGSGLMLTTLAIFKGKRKLKFVAPSGIKTALQVKGWMDAGLMIKWFENVILPYTKGRRSLLVVDKFSAHETAEFLELASKNNVDVAIIPGGCTSKIQPVDVSLNKPLKAIVRKKWMEYVHSLVDAQSTAVDKLTPPTKELLLDWLKDGMEYLEKQSQIVKKSFLVCGITNALDGSENTFIRCAKELPGIQLPYLDELEDDPFEEVDLDELEDDPFEEVDDEEEFEVDGDDEEEYEVDGDEN